STMRRREASTREPSSRSTSAAWRRPEAGRGAGVATQWDAGELGCGELVLELRFRLSAPRPGELFRPIAPHPRAPADTPAWCRMTGHTLLTTQHPVYLIQRKED